MMYILYLIILLVILYIAYYLFRDIISPSFILTGMYILSIVAAMIGFFSWNNEKDLFLITLFIGVMGILSFLLGEYIARNFLKKKKNKSKSVYNIKVSVNDYTIILLITLMIVTIALTIYEIKQLCLNYGFDSNNLFDMLYFYRKSNNLLAGGNLNAVYDLNFITKQLLKFCFAFTVFLEFFFASNILKHESIKKSILYLFGILIGFACTLLTTGRSMFFHLIIAQIIIFAILIYKRDNTFSEFIKKYKILIACAPVFCIILLYLLMPLLGRKNPGGLIESTSFALGTHIPALNKIIVDPNADKIYKNKHLTFENFYMTLNKIGIHNNYTKSEDMWYRFGRYSSNTFTSLYRYYHDYDIFGVVILQFIFGFIITKLYLLARKNILGLIIYAYFFYTVVDQIRGDQFYGLITSSTVAYLTIIFCLYYILIYRSTAKNEK